MTIHEQQEQLDDSNQELFKLSTINDMISDENQQLNTRIRGISQIKVKSNVVI